MINNNVYRKWSHFGAIYYRHGGGSELTVAIEPKLPPNDEIICLCSFFYEYLAVEDRREAKFIFYCPTGIKT